MGTIKPPILLVDDEAGIRKVLGLTLRDMGYEVHTAGDAQQATEAFEEVRPDIVVTDIKMPGADGIELLNRIKKARPETQVIMITGHGDMDLAVKSLKNQASDFITKPINPEALEIALQRAGERIAMGRQLENYTRNLEQLVQEKTKKLLEAERMAAVGQTVAALSHTIRNITGSLKGGVFVLEKGMELEDKQYLADGWQMVKGNVDRIKNLSMDLLHYAKSDQIRLEPTDPNAPAIAVESEFAARAREKDVALDIRLTQDPRPVWMDEEGIRLCLDNLVANALEACEEASESGSPGTVTLTVSPVSGGGVQYRVQDTAGGMDEKACSRVFQEFYTSKGKDGTGVGLMLTKQIVARHQGGVGVESEPGKGSVFWFWLPGTNPET